MECSFTEIRMLERKEKQVFQDVLFFPFCIDCKLLGGGEHNCISASSIKEQLIRLILLKLCNRSL